MALQEEKFLEKDQSIYNKDVSETNDIVDTKMDDNDNYVKFDTKPQVVVKWKDDKTDAIGWVVFHKFINGIAGGGIFMHSQATLEETANIAFNMSKKFTVCVPQIGGAKAGIRFDHRDPRAKAVLKRFIQSNEILLKNMWVTAGDLNTDDTYIEEIIQQELGLITCQATLGRLIAESQGNNKLDRSPNLSKLIQLPASPYFPLIEGAVGYGLSESIIVALELSHWQNKFSNKLPRVLIQGFGAVGSSLAYYLQKLSIALVVGICDKDGYIHSSKGLDIIRILETRHKRKTALELSHALQSDIAECVKNVSCNLSLEQKNEYNYVERNNKNDLEFLSDFLKSEEAEIICPCAQRYQITNETINVLNANTWKNVSNDYRFLICGANNPYGIWMNEKNMFDEDKDNDVLKMLIKSHVMVIPDWVGNSGTAQLFHRGLSLDFDLHADKYQITKQVLKACALPIRMFLLQAYSTLQSPLSLWLLPIACDELAYQRLIKPIDMTPSFHLNPGRSRYALPALPKHQQLSLDARYDLCHSIGENCVNDQELKELLSTCENPVAYDGFEPSGRMHIAQGLLKALFVDRMTKSGFTYLFWIADWFALLNHKMGGNLDNIQTVGKYFIEVWKAAGMDTSRVKFLWCSEEIQSRHDEYWKLVFSIATRFTTSRVKRACEIMGRKDSEKLTASQILYPCMQCADIFFLGVDVCQLGTDQDKVNMLAREYITEEKVKKDKLRKPIILSHFMLPGLKSGQGKMSKSDPDSALFMEDTETSINNKIGNAFCPAKTMEDNPVAVYLERIVFPYYENKNGVMVGNNVYNKFEQLKKDYEADKVSPQQLKASLAKYLNELLQPVRNHFVNNKTAAELLAKVEALRKIYYSPKKITENVKIDEED